MKELTEIQKAASTMGKKSWLVRASDDEIERMKEMSKLGVEARKNKVDNSPIKE